MLTIKTLKLFSNSPLGANKEHVRLPYAKRLVGIGVIPLYNNTPVSGAVGQVVSVTLNNSQQIVLQIPLNPIGNPNSSYQKMLTKLNIELPPNSYLTITQLSGYPFIEGTGNFAVKIYVQWQ